MPGWFEDTLPSLSAANVKFSVVRIDADWYSSTKDVLDNVYHLISDGGFIIIDDYNLPGCKLAVDEFREKMEFQNHFKLQMKLQEYSFG
jgi:predicted O-methyltransferase YrrM